MKYLQQVLIIIIIVIISPHYHVFARPHIWYGNTHQFIPSDINYQQSSPIALIPTIDQQQQYYYNNHVTKSDPIQYAGNPPPPQRGPVRLFLLSFHRFPWPLERWVERIQNYFSTYTIMQPPLVEPVVVEEVNIGPDIIPPDALEPEISPNRRPSSPAIVAIEIPSPSWPTANTVEENINMPNKEPIIDQINKPSWPNHEINQLVESSTKKEEEGEKEVENNTESSTEEIKITANESENTTQQLNYDENIEITTIKTDDTVY